MERKHFLMDLLARYLILIAIAIPNLYLFYFIFTPLTVYPTYLLLKLFFNSSLSGNTLFVNGILIEIISACVSGSAYYLLLILNLSTPNIKIKKRVAIFLFSSFIFLLLNILRIFFLSILLINGSSLFDVTHQIFWYGLSTIFVVLIWFANVKLFKIKNIPFYSDIKKIFSFLNNKK